MTKFPFKSLINKLRKTPRIALIFVGLLAACAPAALPLVDTPPANPTTETTDPADGNGADNSPSPTATVDLNLDKYVFVPMLPRDAIRPVYNPEFVEALMGLPIGWTGFASSVTGSAQHKQPSPSES